MEEDVKSYDKYITTMRQTLIDAGKSAECIVVGRRGHGGFFGLVLGSVAQQVAYHASCPVVLIPND